MRAGSAAGDQTAGGQPEQRWMAFGALAEAIRGRGVGAEPGAPGSGQGAARAHRLGVPADHRLGAAGDHRLGVPGDHRTRVVGIDGLSGAGKSEFALRLARELGSPLLSTDDLVPGWNGLAESVALLVDWVLRPLAAGQSARWRRYDWLTGQPGEWADLEPGEYLVVEGCCVGLPQAARYLSYLVWIDAPADERRLRLTRRGDWPAYAPHADNWARQEKELQSGALTPERADLIVDNSKTRGAGDWTADGFSCRPR